MTYLITLVAFTMLWALVYGSIWLFWKEIVKYNGNIAKAYVVTTAFAIFMTAWGNVGVVNSTTGVRTPNTPIVTAVQESPRPEKDIEDIRAEQLEQQAESVQNFQNFRQGFLKNDSSDETSN